MDKNEVFDILSEIIKNKSIKKIVLSKPKSSDVLKKEIHLFSQNEQVKLQISTYTSDNKVLHQNLDIDDNSAGIIFDLLQNEFKQCNIFTVRGDCEIKVGKKSMLVINKIAANTNAAEQSSTAENPAHIKEHNKTKKYLINEGVPTDFLCELGIMDKNGRVYDKMQDKFKQINRFVSLIDDVFSVFDTGRTINIIDLCCGKSYLTFAVHYYFTKIKKVPVNIIGVDLKEDVINYCSGVVGQLSLTGISFIYGDILEYTPQSAVDMIISLHACDIATDIVLAGAIKWNAKLIMSSPCCHHELSTQIGSETFEIITKYPILKQKFSELATDALRGQMLECFNYNVQMIEFIDPENTPKNLLIRAVKNTKSLTQNEALKRKTAYDNLCRELNVNPSLQNLVKKFN